MITSVLLVLAVKRSHVSPPVDAERQSAGVLDFGDEATRRSILSFASTGARLWSTSLVNDCARGSDEHYRLTVDGVEADQLLVELVVQSGSGSISLMAPRWSAPSNRMYVAPTAGFIVPPPPAPELIQRQQDLGAPALPITHAVTFEQLATARRHHSALIQSGIPVVTSRFGLDGSTWVVESCLEGRYNYFARWSPDTNTSEDKQLIRFAAYLLELAHRPIKFVD